MSQKTPEKVWTGDHQMNTHLHAREVRVIEFTERPWPGDTFRAQGLLWTIIEIENDDGQPGAMIPEPARYLKAQETNPDGTRVDFVTRWQWRGWDARPISTLPKPKVRRC